MITYAILYITKLSARRVYKLLCCYVSNPTDTIDSANIKLRNLNLYNLFQTIYWKKLIEYEPIMIYKKVDSFDG